MYKAMYKAMSQLVIDMNLWEPARRRSFGGQSHA
ncbi:MAG: hypothetical protein ACJAWL_002218 [Motiliproteus sp.]|jgi:hypothetical protein